MREKIIASLMAAIMTLVTLATPILAGTTFADYPKPFCDGGVCDSPGWYLVYGSKAKAEDLAGGGDLLARLSGESYELTTTGATTEAAVTGEGTRIDTSSNRIIPGEAINNARTTITDTELPVLLADGTLYGDDGTAYAYTQDIQINGNAYVLFSDSDNDITDPALHIEMVPTSGSPTYTTRVTFSKSVPVNSTDIIDNTITLFGNEYTIGSGSDGNTLILYGGAETVILSEGDEITVTVGGTDYTVKLEGVSDENTAVITVDGVTESMDQGNTKKISGLDVYLSACYYYSKTGTISQAKLSLGSQKITLENGDEVLIGTNTYIDETAVTITGSTTTNLVSAFTIATPAQDSDLDDIEVGESYTDPVWGTFKLEFSSTTPALDAAANDVITISGSADTASIKFTNYGDYEKTIDFTYDNNTAAGTVTNFLMDSNSYEYIIKEGDNVLYKHYVILDQADDTHLLQLTNVPAGQIKTTDILRFEDVFTGTLYEHTFTSGELKSTGANVSMRIGTQDYYVSVFNQSTKAASYVQIHWQDTSSLSTDASASYGHAGDYTIFPQIKAKNGEYIIFVNNYTKVTNGSSVVLPYQGTTKAEQTVYRTAAGATFLKGKLNYTYDNQSESGDVRVVPTPLKDYSTGIMILEEERADNNYYAIYIGIDETGTTTKTVKVVRPTFAIDYNPADIYTRLTSDTKPEYTTWGSDTYYSSAIDQWGVVVEYYNKDECKATITYPDTQLYADIFFLTEEAVVSTAVTGGETFKKNVPITWSVNLVDTDIQDPSTVTKHLILIGGSCANTLVQKLVDDGKLDAKYTCAGGTPGEGWETGKGYAWIIQDAFATGYDVLVVAGTSKEDTKTACSVFQQFDTLLKDNTNTAIEITSATTAGITGLVVTTTTTTETTTTTAAA